MASQTPSHTMEDQASQTTPASIIYPTTPTVHVVTLTTSRDTQAEEEEEQEEWDDEMQLLNHAFTIEEEEVDTRFTPPYHPWTMGGRPRVNQSKPSTHYTP